MHETTATRVRKVLAMELGTTDAEMTDGARLGEDLGADSLDAVSLELALEEEFAIAFPEADDGVIGESMTVAQVISLVDQHLLPA